MVEFLFEDLLQSMFFNRHSQNLHAHGYRDEGEKAASFVQKMDDMINKHNQYIRDNGKDMLKITEWRWKDVR
ncbi:hypothetical protein [Ligilactobacillus aviarius]|uniref:phosphoketolase family protein n=1 Tax=Ligilactobacillus aviarius TaxID=1606 RepID=UPI00388D4947